MKTIIVSFAVGLGLACCAEAAVIDLYGAPNSFGTLGASVPTGQSLTKNAISNWQLDPGQAAFFPAAASDGTVFIANMAQTFNQLLPTSCNMAVTCFNPTSAACLDSVTGTAQNFGTIRIPTGAGNTYIPPGGCTSLQGVCTLGTCTSGKVGQTCATNLDCTARGSGVDVSDVESIPDAGAGERVLFNSALGSYGSTSTNVFPMFGGLTKSGGAWALDAASTRTPLQFQQSNLTGGLGAQACPNSPVPCCTNADCPASGTCVNAGCGIGIKGTCNSPCATNNNCAAGMSCVGGQCGIPSCGALNETARLPKSGRIAVTEYFGGIIVIDTTGVILAYYPLPITPDPCNTANNLILAPREVDADPSSVLNDERFIVIYDVFNTANPNQPAQEFRYDESTHSLTPVSAPIVVTTATNPNSSCGQTAQVQGGQYDHQGNLWLVRSTGISGGPVDVYLKDPATGTRKLETDCSFTDPSTGQPRRWGFPCVADVEAGLANIQSTALPNWILPWEVHVLEDPTTGAMFIITFSGEVVPIERSQTSDGTPFTVRNKITLGKSQLKPPRPAYCSGGTNNGSSCTTNANCPGGGVCVSERRDMTKGILDAAHRALWAPVTTSESSGPDGCNFFTCKYEVGVVRDAWLYRLDIDQTLNFGVRPSQIQSPSSVASGLSFTISITANLTDALDTSKSFVAVYVNGSATPTSPIAWSSSCSGGSCTFTASVPGSVTSGVTGSLVWHAFLANFGASKALHTVGRAKITPPLCQ